MPPGIIGRENSAVRMKRLSRELRAQQMQSGFLSAKSFFKTFFKGLMTVLFFDLYLLKRFFHKLPYYTKDSARLDFAISAAVLIWFVCSVLSLSFFSDYKALNILYELGVHVFVLRLLLPIFVAVGLWLGIEKD